MRFGHTYWRIVAMRAAQGATLVVQRCDHCGELRVTELDGDWTDDADGFFDAEPPRAKEART